jgi:hypothetical protein
MKNFIGYKCSQCGAEYLQGQVTYTCPKDGGNLDVVLDYDSSPKTLLRGLNLRFGDICLFYLSTNLQAIPRLSTPPAGLLFSIYRGLLKSWDWNMSGSRMRRVIPPVLSKTVPVRS